MPIKMESILDRRVKRRYILQKYCELEVESHKGVMLSKELLIVIDR